MEIGLYATFQSLLHQGISLLNLEIPRYGIENLVRFNPFFIRASVYCIRAVDAPQRILLAQFQSLLHQGISLLTRK